ncbi:MAG: ATP-binding protein, partial [Thermodesulfobacteriota bacterium]|nr:ATP-binding protein [Thermodesulfobacteriota bacterium]
TFQEAGQGRLAYSRIVILDRIPVIFIAAPVFYDGRQVAVLWSRLNAKPIWDVVIQLKRDLNFKADGHVYLLDRDKTLIAGDEVSRQFGQVLDFGSPHKPAAAPHLDLQALRETKHFDTYDPATLKSLLKGWHSRPDFWISPFEEEKTIFVRSSIKGMKWTLYMVQPYAEAFYFLIQGFWASAGLVVLVILVGVPLTWVTARRFLAPVARLRQGVARAAAGNLSQPIEIKTQDEIEELARHFNEMQASLQEYINRLVSTTEDLNHAKCLAVLGTTASKVNHQVGNFLNNLGLALSIIKIDHLSDPSRHSLAVIEENTRQIQMFIERLLNFSRRADLTLTPWLPGPELKRILDARQDQAKEKQVTLSLKAVTTPPILADRVLLEQALLNLLDNALEATPPEGRVEVGIGLDGERIKIEIEDTGHGIAPEDLDNIFTPFFTTKKGKGTGLGLALVQTIIEAHGGEVIITSRPDQGTKATCWLPAAPAVLMENRPLEKQDSATGPDQKA